MGVSVPFVFDGMTEFKDSLTVYFHDQHGAQGAVTFGDVDSDEEYHITCVGQGGRDYDGAPDPNVWFGLLKRGSPSQKAFSFPDEPDSGISISHWVSVTAPKERASALAHAVTLFMKGTRWTLEHLYRVPKLKAITYDTDAFIISYDLYDTLKLGLTTAHRRLLTEYCQDYFESDLGFTCMTFCFLDEESIELKQKFLVPTEHITEIAAELNTFVMAFKERHDPKAEAAIILCIFLQAA